jgi:hypothetical protein
MQSLDFGVMIDSYSSPNPLCSHGRPPYCAQAFVAAICGWIGKNSSRTWTVHGAFFQIILTPLSCPPRPSSRLHKTRTSLLSRLDVCFSGACPTISRGDDSEIRPAHVGTLVTFRHTRVRKNKRTRRTEPGSILTNDIRQHSESWREVGETTPAVLIHGFPLTI